MSTGPVARMLDATRLHLHHGPIDLIIDAWGPDRQRALGQADTRFQTVLTELVDELALLRAPLGGAVAAGKVACRMVAAIAPFTGVFVTPMAAVAGAVADEVLTALVAGCDLERAYVNNGGDIAVWLAAGQSLTAVIHNGRDTGRVRLDAAKSARGLATSGWRGRSHSLGIADAVTVVARTAAMADAAATLIGNAVDLPGHPAISRQAAQSLAPDSDLGDRLVTVNVGAMSARDAQQAVARGVACAQDMRQRGLIEAAVVFLAGQNALCGELILEQGAENARLQIA